MLFLLDISIDIFDNVYGFSKICNFAMCIILHTFYGLFFQFFAWRLLFAMIEMIRYEMILSRTAYLCFGLVRVNAMPAPAPREDTSDVVTVHTDTPVSKPSPQPGGFSFQRPRAQPPPPPRSPFHMVFAFSQ